jgi:hypothetical protein
MRLCGFVVLGGAVLVLSACGGGSAAPPTAAPAVSPVASRLPTATGTTAAPPATATPAPKPTEASQPAKSDTVWVGNTDGEGVYIRTTPLLVDRVRAYVDGTPLTIIGDDVEGDGLLWKHVRAPDGLEGYVPAMYTTDAPP